MTVIIRAKPTYYDSTSSVKMIKNYTPTYPLPAMGINFINAYANSVNISVQYDTAGDSAALVDFIIKINNVAATLTTYTDSADSIIQIGFTETVQSGDIVTIFYTPNAARYIEGPWTDPTNQLYDIYGDIATNMV